MVLPRHSLPPPPPPPPLPPPVSQSSFPPLSSSPPTHNSSPPSNPQLLSTPMSYAATLKAAPPAFPATVQQQQQQQQQPQKQQQQQQLPPPPPQHPHQSPILFHPGQPFRPNPSQPSFTPGSQQVPNLSTPKPWYPDVYTLPFIPQYLQVINTLPAATVTSLPPPSIQFHAFISSFCGSSFLRLLPPPPAIPPTPAKPVPTPSTDLNPSTYFDYFFNLLSHEVSSQHERFRKYDMYNEPLYHQDLAQSLYRLIVPGIRENTPLVQLGDVVRLRQVRIHPASYMAMGGGSFNGFQYDACVYGMDKTVGYIVLRVDHLMMESGRFNVCFCVQEKRWAGPARAVEDLGGELKNVDAMERLVITNGINGLNINGINGVNSNGINGSVNQDIPRGGGFVRRMLFPEKADGVLQRNLGKGAFNRGWFDGELNYEQQKAVDAIVQQNYGNIPYLISGPPGTGKTKTIVEAVLQLIFTPSSPKQHILLCAPSHEAADTLAKRLIPYLNPKVLFRLQSSARTFPEVPGELLPYSYIANDMFSLPEWKTLMGFRVIVCSTRDAEILVEARCTNRDLARWEKGVVDSLRGIVGDEKDDNGRHGVVEKGQSVNVHWTALLLDEAAQGIEPEVAVALSVVAPPEEASLDRPIFVMAGDQKQLGPRTTSKITQLDMSLFERLFLREIYSQHPLARHSFGVEQNPTGWSAERVLERKKALLPYLRPPFTNLIRNYRSHPAILAVPSALFYSDTLVPEAGGTEGMECWAGWKGRKGIPIKFCLNGGQDEWHEEGVSFYNLREIQIACNIAKDLVSSGLIEPHEIAIMAQFREQIKRLRKALRSPSYGLRNVNVGPIEIYQGSEHKLVIICTTRSRERFLEGDLERGLGVVFENRRACVALTRAKQGLIVIGNPWILGKDPTWRAWMGFAWRHDAVEKDPFEEAEEPRAQKTDVSQAPTASGNGKSPSMELKVNFWQPPEDERETPQYISRLETALVYKTRAMSGDMLGGIGGGFDGDDPMWTAGIVAEEAVRENENKVNEGLSPNYWAQKHFLDNTIAGDGSIPRLMALDDQTEMFMDMSNVVNTSPMRSPPEIERSRGFVEVKKSDTSQTALFPPGPWWR